MYTTIIKIENEERTYVLTTEKKVVHSDFDLFAMSFLPYHENKIEQDRLEMFLREMKHFREEEYGRLLELVGIEGSIERANVISI